VEGRRTAERIEELLLRSMADREALLITQTEQLRAVLEFWTSKGCERSQSLLAAMQGGDSIQEALARANPRRRLSDGPNRPVTSEQHTVGTICTSGSSGVPMNYRVGQEWRWAHHSAWRLAYRHMTASVLDGYLDSRFRWAMMRPPGARPEDFPYMTNCMPVRSGISHTRPPDTFRPDVVHGSVSTLLEALEDPQVQAWQPSWVIFTYEGPTGWQKELVRQMWPTANQHEEYSSNDGGASAFTCQYGSLHFWSSRAVPCPRTTTLRVVDLWNFAEAFVGYECGDEVEWTNQDCRCGCVFPTVKIAGRTSGVIVLDNGSVVPTFCPFTSGQMTNLRGVRVLVEAGNKATVLLVEHQAGRTNRVELEECLRQAGFEKIEFSTRKSVTALRSGQGKFRTVIDTRGT
jgi:hypothetical protein